MEEKAEIKQVSEREIWIGESRLYLGEDNILYINIVGESDEKTTVGMRTANNRLENMIKEKIDVLVDLNKAGKQSIESRKLGKELIEKERVRKIAFYGLNPVSRVLASFLIAVLQQKKSRFFNTKEEALAWLRE